MIDELNRAIIDYQGKWQELVEKRIDKPFFTDQQPTAVAWKMQDAAELYQKFEELRDVCDQIHFGWVNERWLVTLHLKTTKLAWNIELVKLMQRRPGSEDAIGLDHLDFYSAQNSDATAILQTESDLKWTPEANTHCSWISVWFSETEAKLRTDSVLGPCIAELKELQDTILST